MSQHSQTNAATCSEEIRLGESQSTPLRVRRPAPYYNRRGPVAPGTDVPCNTCGDLFTMTPSQVKRRDYMCSHCVDAGRARRGKPRRVVRTARRRRWEAVRQKISRALKSGRLVQQPCEVCGKEKSVAHHEDYTKPLDVKWLCTLHHWAEHKALAARGWVSNL